MTRQGCHFRSKRGNILKRFEELCYWVREELPVEEAILDGEVVALDSEGATELSRPYRRERDDLLGQKVHYDGQDWTVRYSEVTKRVVLERPIDTAPVLQALRDGAAVRQTDPAELAGQPLPGTREAAAREWLMLDAMIAGGRTHRTMGSEGIDLLERRLVLLTAFLSAGPGDESVAG